MPRKCSVLGCQAMKSCPDSVISTFSFPNKYKFPTTFEYWLKFALLKEGDLNKSSCICEYHFSSLCFNNNIDRKTLKPGSFPTIYTKDQNICCEKQEFESVLNKKSHPKSKTLTSGDIYNHCTILVQKYKIFSLKRLLNNCLLVYIISDYPSFENIFSTQVKSDNSVNFYSQAKEMQGKYFKVFFSKPYVVNCLKKFDLLIEFISKYYKTFNLSLKENVELNIENIQESLEKSYRCTEIISFFKEQLLLSKYSPRNRKYSSELILFAFSVFVKSRSAYNAISKLLFLPSTRSLQSYSSPLNMSVNNDNCNLIYLKSQFNSLKDHEKIVSLKMDEIQINSSLELRGGLLEGFSKNRPDELANHVQAFLINSLLSNYKEIVNLIPVKRNAAESLYKSLIYILEAVEKLGFRVVCITSDNNRINRNCFDRLVVSKTENYFFSKVHPGSKIFLLFDAPHMMKCIRNNWINLKNPKKEFQFNPFKTTEFGTKASFEHIKMLYELERDKTIKLGYKLNSKVIYPSSIERQKVPLALSIFDESTIAALKSLVPNSESTTNFLLAFQKFWKIFNINNPNKGIFKNDKSYEPFNNKNDERLNFLKTFADWLDDWKSHHLPDKLSAETFHSVSFSCRSLHSLVIYLLEDINFKYVLTSKLQTDYLESLFGIYRQMNCSSMLLTWSQVKSAEKKNRIMNSLKLRGQVLKLDHSEEDFTTDEFDFDYRSIDFNRSDFEVEEIQACVYIGGYILKKYYKFNNCKGCMNMFSTDGNTDLDIEIAEEYLNNINRGNLTYPSPVLVHILLITQKFFSEHIENFINKSEKSISIKTLVNLFENILEDLNLINSLNYCQHHPDILIENLKYCLRIFSRILINNFSKKNNNLYNQKKKTLATKSKHDYESQIAKFYN